MASVHASGFTAPQFEHVRKVFEANFEEGLDVGATFAVVWRGALVIDLWGGYLDAARTAPVRRDSLFNLWSATKGVTATCIAMLVDRGLADYETPISSFWPEFARCGKENLNLAHLMSHQAGVCGPREKVSIEDYYDHDRIAAALASQAPFFVPPKWGYHALAIGTLADEVVRRLDGRPIGRFFAEEVAAPLNADLWLGLPESEDGRVATMIAPIGPKQSAFMPPNPEAYEAAMGNPELDPEWPNDRRWRAAGLAGAGGTGAARGLASIYGALANGGGLGSVRLMSSATVGKAVTEQVRGIDQVLGRPGRYGAGFILNSQNFLGPSPQAYGHDGWGGTVAFADSKNNLGTAYVTNCMLVGDDPAWVDPRPARLVHATYSALQRQRG